MQPPSVRAYAAPAAHGAISDLIRHHSTNRLDVRAVALVDVPVAAADRMLDLGCGFGFMAEGLAQRARPGSEIVGVDVAESNRDAFLSRVEAAGCRGRFVCREIDGGLDFLTGGFDVIAASYSLYFFPGAAGAAAARLAPGGAFVAITHREESLRHLLDVLGLPPGEAPHLSVLHRCSAETGAAVLSPHFEDVELRRYPNSLAFGPGDAEALLSYVRFKLPLIVSGFDVGSDVPDGIVRRVLAAFRERGRVNLDKDDAVFVCRRPR